MNTKKKKYSPILTQSTEKVGIYLYRDINRNT